RGVAAVAVAAGPGSEPDAVLARPADRLLDVERALAERDRERLRRVEARVEEEARLVVPGRAAGDDGAAQRARELAERRRERTRRSGREPPPRTRPGSGARTEQLAPVHASVRVGARAEARGEVLLLVARDRDRLRVAVRDVAKRRVLLQQVEPVLHPVSDRPVVERADARDLR